MITIYIALWLISGSASFIYWYTNEYDLTISGLIVALFASVIGPLAFIIGYGIHGDNEKIFIKKRK